MRSNKVVLIFSLLVLLGHGKKSDGNGKGNLEIFKLICESADDMNSANNKGETPLFVAAKNNHLNFLNLSYHLDSNCKKRKKSIISQQSSKKRN